MRSVSKLHHPKRFLRRTRDDARAAHLELVRKEETSSAALARITSVAMDMEGEGKTAIVWVAAKVPTGFTR